MDDAATIARLYKEIWYCRDHRLIGRLLTHSNHTDFRVRARVVIALGLVGQPQHLDRFVGDRSPHVRRTVIYAYEVFNLPDKIIAMASDENDSVRLAIAKSLWSLKQPEALGAMIDDPTPRVQQVVSKALSTMLCGDL